MKITIESRQGRLLLRWVCPVKGKRVSISAAVEDSKAGRGYAEGIKDKIENDAKYGRYDPTLKEYRPRTIGKNATEITTVELFDRFTKYQAKDKGLAQSSIDARYKPIGRMLEKHLNIPAVGVNNLRAEKFADICADTLTAGTAKARIMLLKSAWDWAKDKYHVATENPWVGLTRRFRQIEKQSPTAFTEAEVKAIVRGFRDSRYYSHYADYVIFRLGMATRGGEASALKWKHVSSDCRSVWIGESYSRGVTGSTKTKQARNVIVPDAIANMLKTRKENLNPQSGDDLVFPSPEGLPICDRGFNRRAWKTVLAQVGVPYRKAYTTRKTAISHALANGANYIDVAVAAGHDPQTMHKYYAESIQKGSVFISFE